MAWTYGDAPGTDTAAHRRDAVRLAIGDTDSDDPQPVSDAELDYFLLEAGDNVKLAGALAADKLVGYYARQADTSNGSLSVGASARSAAFAKVASRLRSRAGGLASMFAGGLSIAGKAGLDNDSDAVQPQFSIGRDDLPGSDTSTDDAREE